MQITRWRARLAPDCLEPVHGFSVDTFSQGKELAPRYWRAATEEAGFVVSKDGHVDPSPPWWERYEEEAVGEADEKRSSSFLAALPAPDARVDVDDKEWPSVPLMLVSAQDKMQAWQQRIQDAHAKRMAKRSRSVPEAAEPVADRRLRPDANMYLRPVQGSDMGGITVRGSSSVAFGVLLTLAAGNLQLLRPRHHLYG